VPSSTFNSDSAKRAPELHWNRVWIITCIFVVATVWSCEAFWRARGHRPSIVDSPSLWSYHRRQVNNQKEQVVLLGLSRMQLGFSMNAFHDRFPLMPISNLAINSATPIATLRDLAADESFRGTVICSATASFLNSAHWNDQQEYVHHYHNSGLNQLLEPVFSAWVQDRLVVANPQIRLSRVIEMKLQNDRLPKPLYVKTNFDRSRLADYSLVNTKAIRKSQVNAAQTHKHYALLPLELWSKDMASIGKFVSTINARGGTVVFIRFPTTDEHWDATEHGYPKCVYWDQLASLTGAETIHFRDVPTLAHFDCPDMAHLDYRDAPKFTAALLDELVRRGVLPDESK